jgi:DNA helicase-2/ATP-dependent DNA helicase PcrA
MTNPATGAPHPRPPDRDPDALLAGLTPEQALTVRHGPGPLLVVAGPGTGKTRTLTHRVAHLLATGQAQPREILAVTFSVRAAGELRLRLTDLLGEQAARGVTAATFHSVCARLLREHAGLFGRTDAYTIYDQADLRRVIEWLLGDRRQPEIQQALAHCGQPSAAELETEMALAKSRLHTPDSYRSAATHAAGELVAALWRAVEDELQRCNAWGFDDLLVCAVRLLAEHPPRLAHVRSRWRWLVVDEMQDTNDAQAALVHLLAGPGRERNRGRRPGSGDLPVPVGRAAQHPALRRALPAAPADRADAQLPLAHRDPRGRRRLHRSQRGALERAVDRGARRRRAGDHARVRARARRGRLGGRPDRRRAGRRHAAR